MIMIWNRKEVFIGNSLKEFSHIRAVLNANKINYKYKIGRLNQGVSNRSAATLGENTNSLITYYIYVHRKNYDNACVVLNNNKS